MSEETEFRIEARTPWKFLALPLLALILFAAIVLLAVFNVIDSDQRRIAGYVGTLLFLVVIAIEIPFFLRRKPGAEEPRGEPGDMQDEPPEAPRSMAAQVAEEYFETAEVQQGLRVLEFSAPAKSAHRGAVYAKAYVPVTQQHVLRVETLAAEGAEL